MPVTTEPSAEPTPRFRRLVRNPVLRAYQREIFACSEQALGRGAGRRDRRPPTPSSPFTAAAGLVSVFRVNLEGRDSDTEPPGQCTERALGPLEHSLGEYAVSPTPPPARRAEMPDLYASRPHRDPPVGRAEHGGYTGGAGRVPNH
jgi:hypothetical protein